MQAHQIELLDSIRGLARAIYAETGQYTTYTEGYHSGGSDRLAADVSIQSATNPDEFEFFRAAQHPSPGYSKTFEQMRDDLADWLVAHRKQQEAA